MQVEQLRPAHVLQLSEYAHKFLYVVTVVWSEVSDVQSLEDVLLASESRLHCVVETQNALLAFVGEVAFGVQPLRCLEAQAVVCLVGVEIQKVFFHTTYGTVYRHVVVVKDYEQVVRARRYVVETFECQSAAHGSVADDCNHMTGGAFLLILVPS